MDIQTITKELQQKLTHAVNTKSKAYEKTIANLSDSEKESKMSNFITDLTFEISEKVVKDKIRRINPKSIQFTYYVNREKYFSQTLRELIFQLQDEVYADEDLLQVELNNQKQLSPFAINFNGHFLKDYGYIGVKKSKDNNIMIKDWFPSILKCIKIKNEDDIENSEETLHTLKEFITMGFEKAINQEYVFVDNSKIEDSLKTIDYVLVENNKLSSEEFNSFRKSVSMGQRN